MPDSVPPISPSHIQPDVIREIIRLSELRLAAQLQTRLALEGRLGSSTPWLLATLVAIVGSVSIIRSSTEGTKMAFTVLTLAICLSIFLNFVAMLMSGKWHYGGEVPSSITEHIKVDLRISRFSSFLERVKSSIRKHNKRPLIVVKYNESMFQKSDSSIDIVLYKLAIRYNESILRNDDYLHSMKILLNIPIAALLMGVLIAAYLVPSPKPVSHQPSVTQSLPSTPSQTKPSP